MTKRNALLAAALVALAACDRTLAPTGPSAPAFPARMLVAAGDAQSGTAGTELTTPLTVKVVDANGAPIPGQIVNFRVVAGGGSVFAGAAVTDAQGRAAERWTLGTSVADTQRVEARAVNPSSGAGIVFATFTAVAKAGAASAVTRASADSQVAAPGVAVAAAPTVRVADKFGNPVSGVDVTFAVGAGRGVVEKTTATTDAQGLATAKTWTLGTTPGANTVIATATGLAPITFTATAARGGAAARKWTVMVFMAADNSLAVQGVGDIDEMEAAGVSPDVQVVVQAEFSPSEFARQNCSAACAHLPNFNTFRYAITGGAPSVTGPDGAVTDIGNRNMTDPAQIKEFVQWAKQNYPAEHYALVLWNHGGGYAGLLEDITTSGSHSMSIGELPNALTGVGPIDVLDFDMCLMAGYETLAEVAPLANYVVFSEETEPGEGDPYTGMLKALRASPTADGRAVAGMFVDEWAKFYTGHRASTTKSAYDMAGFAQFEAALNGVANKLAADPSNAALRAAAQKAQRFEIAQLADLGALADTIAARTTDASLGSAVSALRSALANPGFRIKSSARTGTASGANDVSRASGLNLLLPSGSAADALPTSGPLSFAEYQKLLPNTAWTKFLAAYLKTGATVATVDQGEKRFESYVVWDSSASASGADIDMWILEPDGNLYIPYLGTVSPNGHLSPDSYDAHTSWEGYLTNRYVMPGRYKIYANLYSDPKGVKPQYDVQYRFAQTNQFKSLYSPNYPRLSLTTSWLDDAAPSFAKVEADAYTDLQLAAYVDLGTTGVMANTMAAARTPNGNVAAMRAPMPDAPNGSASPAITSRQLAAVRAHWAERAARRRQAR